MNQEKMTCPECKSENLRIVKIERQEKNGITLLFFIGCKECDFLIRTLTYFERKIETALI